VDLLHGLSYIERFSRSIPIATFQDAAHLDADEILFAEWNATPFVFVRTDDTEHFENVTCALAEGGVPLFGESKCQLGIAPPLARIGSPAETGKRLVFEASEAPSP